MFNAIQTQRERGTLIRQLSTTDLMTETTEQLDLLLAQEETFNRQTLIKVLTGATAVIHIYLGGTLFVLNGAGFLALLALHYAVPQRESYQKWTRDGMFGYTGVTLAGYFAVRGTAGFLDPTGIVTKLIELGLMRVLWADRESAEKQPILIIEHQTQLAKDLASEIISSNSALA